MPKRRQIHKGLVHAIQCAVGTRLPHLAPGPHSIRKLFQRRHCILPVDTGISDADALLECVEALSCVLLVALVQVRLNHDTDNAILTFTELVANRLSDLGLVLVILLGVAYIESAMFTQLRT